MYSDHVWDKRQEGMNVAEPMHAVYAVVLRQPLQYRVLTCNPPDWRSRIDVEMMDMEIALVRNQFSAFFIHITNIGVYVVVPGQRSEYIVYVVPGTTDSPVDM
jgi:hypothetical protein